MIYASLKTIRAWHNRLTAPVYLAFAAATGACMLGAVAVLFGRFQLFQALFAAVLLLVVLVLKILYWRAIDRAPLTHTIESATGLGRIGRVSQWEQPHSSANYVQKEMGYAVARRHAEKLRGMVLAFLAIAIALSLIAIAVSFAAIPAAIVALAAAAVERWLFFAEAKHVVTLFYGEKAA
jgi:sulfite dehydrogenase (quinone) subunit SoeC